jgi:D-serine deaminase-like pyridoxal phosphate-dependent protein
MIEPEQLLDWRVKGGPGRDVEVAAFVASRPSLFDAGLLPPVLTLDDAAVESNLATMAEFCRHAGVELAPHGKTHMSPALAARQIRAGAWGMTVATPSQARVYLRSGVRRVLLANELVDPAAIAWVSRELDADEDLTFVCYIDSIDGVRLLDTTLAECGGARTLDVMVEFGPLGGRTGCRSLEQAELVARAAANSPRLRLAGVSGFEGTISHDRQPDALDAVRALLRLIRAGAQRVADLANGFGPFYVSAGGSAFFDLVVEELAGGWQLGRAVTVLLRSGCYLTHDDGIYERQTPFGRSVVGRLRPALRLWSLVQSVPEPGLAILGFGRRDTSFDVDLPTPQVRRRRDGTLVAAGEMTVFALDDQHAYVRLGPGEAPQVGEWVGLGISHPCTALDKWRRIAVVDADLHVVDYLPTFF